MYNPQTQYRGDVYLARGISNAGENAKQLLGYFAEQGDEAKRFRATLKAMDPENKDQYDAMGHGELKGKLDAMALQRADKIQQEQMDLAKQHAALYQAEADRQNAGLEAARRFAGLVGNAASQPDLSNLSSFAQGGDVEPRRVTPEMLMQFAGQAGVSDPRVLQGFTQLAELGQTGNPDGFTEDPRTGARFFRSGKSVLPSGTNPEVAAGRNLVPMLDEQGNETGYQGYYDGKAMRVVKSPAQPIFRQAVDDKGKPIPDLYLAPNGQAVDRRTAMQKSGVADLGAEPATAPSAGATPIKVTTRAEYDKLPSGTRFIGGDGRIYTKP